MGAPKVDFPAWLAGRVRHIEAVLDQVLPEAGALPETLHQAMRYAVMGGGKRVRAALVYAAGQACRATDTATTIQDMALDHAAAAVELVHAYSLVHDDLPCMDDDALRRGRPTLHVRYDEATAMLAGDALQPLAFGLLAQMPIAPALIVQAVQILAHSAGSLGMAGGQAIDCASVGSVLTREELGTMHSMKTGAMLGASVLLGGIVAGASSTAREALESYAAAVGLAFQVADDILDVTSDTATLGKTAGKDALGNKPTYVSLMGLDGSRQFLEALHADARAAILPLGTAAARLDEIADYIVGRNH
ncbi:polyprenyl synthetase family protein [Paralcaligenes ureilyticus]|uniref:Farnesyl-diphosphate synthase n=1 Tax=Paralcaligenes ureilyticus TaxID=627131 RepID=A0A4R3LWA0_9BURK|nr:farnesyl diphosphate synthase [Paralcaligenes ureilyticus]TCT04853.1 farnesyl-diphosphate synthase [Paralcaligenes ureilyticus]